MYFKNINYFGFKTHIYEPVLFIFLKTVYKTQRKHRSSVFLKINIVF